MRIFIDGYGSAAEAIVSKLIRNHEILPKNLLLNTYELPENQSFLNFLKHMGVTFFCEAYANPAFYLRVRDFQPTYIASIYGRRIIPQSFLNLCTGLAFNLHPSLLPFYRGCFSSAWAILNGEKTTGITIHKMVEKIDAGDILFQKEIKIANDETAYSLYHKLIGEFVAEFDGFFKSLLTEKIHPQIMQRGGDYYPRQIPFDGLIDKSWDDARIERFIRAMHFPPHEGAIYQINGARVECSNLSDYKRFF